MKPNPIVSLRFRSPIRFRPTRPGVGERVAMQRTARERNPRASEDVADAEMLIRLVDKTFDMETARGESLSRQTSMLIACVSIMGVALATVFAALVNVGCDRAMMYLFALNATALLGGFCSCVVAMFRKPYKVLVSPRNLRLKADETCSRLKRDEKQENVEDAAGVEFLAARRYADSLEDPYDGLYKKNEFIRLANGVALVFLLVSCGISFASLGYAFIGA